MRKQIKSLAKIQSGLYIKAIPDGDAYYLQVKDFDIYGRVVTGLTTMVKLDVNLCNHLLTGGDLLFAAKGTTNFCAVYDPNIGNAFASSSFLVLRTINREIVLPEFLCWFINHPNTMQILKSHAVGTSIPSITKSAVGDLEIDLPTIEIQKTILQVAELQRREIELCNKIAQKRIELVNQSLIKLIR